MTYKEQKTANGASLFNIAENKYDGKPYISLSNMEGAVLTGTSGSSCSIEVYGGKNNVIDVSKNNKEDDVFISNSLNVKVKTDDNDELKATMQFKNTDKWQRYDNSKKAGTYTYAVGDSFIKRENVPQLLLSDYDNIAKQNGNNKLDTTDEINKFTEVVQLAFQKQQISQKNVEKMEFSVQEKPESIHTAQNYAIVGGCIGTMVGLGIPIVSQVTAGIGVVTGGIVGGIVEIGIWAYDKFAGIKDNRVLTHWGVE